MILLKQFYNSLSLDIINNDYVKYSIIYIKKFKLYVLYSQGWKK